MFRLVFLGFFMFSLLSIAKGENLNRSDTTCGMFGKLAEVIMENRQLDVPMSSVIELVSSTEGTAEQKQMVRKLVLLAYEQPSYATQSNREDETRKFRNLVEVACYKNNQ